MFSHSVLKSAMSLAARDGDKMIVPSICWPRMCCTMASCSVEPSFETSLAALMRLVSTHISKRRMLAPPACNVQICGSLNFGLAAPSRTDYGNWTFM